MNLSTQSPASTFDDAPTTAWPQRVLWLSAALFVVFSLGFVVAPAAVFEMITGAVPGTPGALIDVRATYGGMNLGFGLFLAMAALRPAWRRAGLLAGALVFACVAAGRLLGILIDGPANALTYAGLVSEIVMADLLAWAYSRSK